MARFFKKRTENRGLPPGSLVFIGTKKTERPTIDYLEYNEQSLEETELVKEEDLPRPSTDKMQWYNITGLDEVGFMAQIAQKLGIHPLAMEDVMNTGQRAKFVEFDDFVFITLKMLHLEEEQLRVITEQVSFILKDGALITFQEQAGDTFDPVRYRLRTSKGILRQSGSDYPTYALLDTIVDNYIYLIEGLREKIDELEFRVLEKQDQKIIEEINAYKRELHFILKVAKPFREAMLTILKSDTEMIKKKKILPYYKDLMDLVTHAIESAEAYRTVLSDYLQLYHSIVSNKMNDIMKVLTIFSAIFIPLSFFAGVYGTNFDYFPELHYKYSYYIFWGVIVLIALTMLLYFRRKKWL